MSLVTRGLPAIFMCSLVVVGCGGGDDGGGRDDRLPAGVAAQVDNKLIRDAAVRTALDRRYAALGGTARSFGPPGYASCVTAKQDNGLRPGETVEDLRSQCRFEFDVTRAQVVSDLVRTLWLARETARLGIDTDGDVKAGLSRATRLAALGHKQATDQADLKAFLETHARYEKLMAAIPVSEQEIAAYGVANGDVFLASEQRIVQVLQATSRRKVVRARQELERHAGWPAVQDRYGIKPFKGRWTGTQTVDKSRAPTDAFGRSMFTSKPGRLVGPIHTLNGWFLFEVARIRPPSHRGLTSKAHRAVATTIRSTRLDKRLRSRYFPRTTCASQYRLTEAPQCM